MEEKSRENLDRGIDIAVSVLKHEFPFITGWDYKNDPETYRSSIYLVLMADMNLASEFYNSPIRNVYKHSEAKVAYPFSPLELSTELDEDKKYELFKVIQESLVEIYDEIPSELRHEFESYASELKLPKELYVEGFIFEKPKKNINEQFDIDYYETKYNPPKEESDEEINNLTKNDLLEYGKRYFSKKFFRLFSPKKWRHAVNNRWLEDICNELHWDECGGDNKKIYGFFFEKDGQKYVYVGITNNITSRFRTHLDIKKTRLSKFQKAIEELEINPKDIDFSVLFPFFLPPNNAAQIEINLIKYFIEDPNYICLNAATGGQLGSRGSSKYIIDNSAKFIKIQNIKDEEEFMKLYPKEYNYLKKTRRLKYVNNLLDKRFFKQGQYSEKELEQIAKQYPSRGKLRMIDVNAYEAIRHRGLLDKFFPRNINESKSDEIERNLEAINLILSEISWDGLCEIWVEYNEVDGDYEIRSKSTKRHFDYDNINNELGYLDNTLRSMGLRTYIYTPWYVEECEDEVEFLNEDYSPAGKEVIPNEVVVHKSNPMFRDSIMSDGLKAKAGECYKIYAGYGEKCIPAIFATNSKNKRAWFDSTYDDDIWFIDTTKISDVKWFKDRHFESRSKHIVTFQNIPKDAITLKHEGTGKDWGLMESFDKSENKKLELVTKMIHEFFDEVSFIDIKKYENKPMIRVYFDNDEEAGNEESYFAEQIQDKIYEYTGIKLIPYWRTIPTNTDAYFRLDAIKLKYDGEGNVINEAEENKKEKKFNRLIQNVEDYLNSNEYPSVKRFTVYYEDTHDDVIVNIFFDAEEAVKLGGGINSVIKKVGKQVMSDLEIFPLDFKYYTHFDKGINEAEEKQPKYLNIIKNLIEPFKNEDCVCEINVLYDEEDDMYSVYLVLGNEELNNNFYYVTETINYRDKLANKIKTEIKSYLPIDNLYVGSYGKPNCDWHKEKKTSINAITND